MEGASPRSPQSVRPEPGSVSEASSLHDGAVLNVFNGISLFTVEQPSMCGANKNKNTFEMISQHILRL